MEASEDGTALTGKVLGEIVDGQRKKELLETIALLEHISLDQVFCTQVDRLMKTIAVGDGANDIFMLDRSSFGVAYNAKPKLQEKVYLLISLF